MFQILFGVQQTNPTLFEHHSLQTIPMPISAWSEHGYAHRHNLVTIGMHPQSHPLSRSLTHHGYNRGQCRTYMPRPMPNMHATVGTAMPPRSNGRHRPPRGISLRHHTHLARIYPRHKGETLVLSILLAFVSDTVVQSVEVVVDVYDHFLSSWHG